MINPIFLPSIKPELSTVPLAFISAPKLQSDSAVAVLSAERYVKENYAHIRKFDVPLATANTTLNVFVNNPGTDVLGLHALTNAYSYAKTIEAKRFEFNALCSPIKLLGLTTTQAASWNPVITPGIVWREYTVRESEFNPGTDFDLNGVPSNIADQASWLVRSGVKVGDKIILIYTVPEHTYKAKTKVNLTDWPGSATVLRTVKENSPIAGKYLIKTLNPALRIQSIKADGQELFNGIFDGTEEDTIIESIDGLFVKLRISLPPESLLEVVYDTYNDTYAYSGYRDYKNRWHTFDANPEYGHYIQDTDLKLSAECLLDQVNIYLIPTAYLKISTADDNVFLDFKSAFSYGESHFVRHLTGQNIEDIQARIVDGPINTFGIAVFGRNFYDEPFVPSDDVFNSNIPSMMPLGKIVMAAPAAINSVALADVRTRGGGVPVDYNFDSIQTDTEGIDFLRSCYDVGIWDGAVYTQGGVLKIELADTILTRFDHETILGIIQSHIAPGIAIEVVYYNV